LASTKLPSRIVGGPHASSAETTNAPAVGCVATHDTVGGTVSTTITCCTAVEVLPLASCAVHVTGVSPTKYFGSPLFVKVTVPAQSSVAVGVPSGVPLQSFRWMSGGTNVKTGGVVSTIVTVCCAVCVGSNPSLALQVTVFGPTGNWNGASFVTATGSARQMSVAEARPK